MARLAETGDRAAQEQDVAKRPRADEEDVQG
jgi:hypothetical protein